MIDNTLNICLSHVPLHPALAKHVDILLAPKDIGGDCELVIVPDDRVGAHGGSLSEYNQLLWMYENIGQVARDYEYLRVFHYRRIISEDRPTVGRKLLNVPWAYAVRHDELHEFDYCFERFCDGELYNTKVLLQECVLFEYSNAHVLFDLLNFSKFLIEEEILTPQHVTGMLSTRELVPSCSLGTVSVNTFMHLFAIIARAAKFLHSPYFVYRDPPQRRVLGFLLERLHSYLLLQELSRGITRGTFGYNVTISDSDVILASS